MPWDATRRSKLKIGTTGFESRVAFYLLPYPASVGSTEAAASLLARVGVVGPKRATRLSDRVRLVSRTGKELLPGIGAAGS
jgi:hypothetical protein